MELLQLRYFILAAQMENITRAAQMLNIPQPALSSTIKRLETELGTALFERKGNKVTLNEVGRRYLQKVEASIRLIDDANQEARDDSSGDLSGDISLLILTNRRMITEYVAAFYKTHKNVSFQIAHEGSPKSHYNLYIMDSENLLVSMESELLIEEKIVIAVNQEHRFATRKTIAIEELRDENFITMPPDSSLYRNIMQACLRSRFCPTANITCADPFYIRKYVSEGLGVALVPSYSWQGMFDERIVLLNLKKPIFRQNVIAWSNKHYMSKTVEAFLKFVLNETKTNQS